MKSQISTVLALSAAVTVAITVGCSNEARLERTLRKAERFYAAGDFASAEIEYLNSLRLDPSCAPALRGLGYVYFEQGRFLQAYPALSEAKDLDPENLAVRLKLGVTLAAGGQYEEAREGALFVLSKQPTNDTAFLLLADATRTTNDLADSFERLEEYRAQAEDRPGYHLALGALYIRGGDLARGRNEIMEALELDPQNADVQAALGRFYLVNNDLERADAHLQQAAQLEGWRSARKLAYAQFKIRTGDAEEGKRLLEEMIENAPDYFPAWIRLAEQGLSERQFDECRKLVEEMLRRDPKNYDARLLAGRLHLAQGDPDSALSEFEYLSSMFSEVASLHYYLGLAHSMKGDDFAALASLSRALQINPDLEEAVYLKAELNIRNGEYSQAVNSLREFMEEHRVSERGLALLAEAYRRLGNVEDALAICQEWVRVSPTNTESWLLAGRLLLQQNQRLQAREAFNKVLEIKPDHFVAAEELVNLDLAEGDPESAAELARALLDQHPQSPVPLVLLAKVHVAQGKFAETESRLRQAIQLAPEASTAYLVLAQVQIQSGQLSNAVGSLQKLLAIEPRHILGLMQMATLQQQLGNPRAAAEAYEKLLAVDPGNGVALNNLAALYSAELNDLDRAYNLAKKARVALPEDPAVMDTLGWILYQRGDYSGASPLLRDAADRLPGEAEVLFHLGMNYYMLGRESEARAALEKARGMNRTFEGFEEMDERLSVLSIDPNTAGPEIKQELEERLKQDRTDPIGWMCLAAIYQREGESAKAAKAYEATIKLAPNVASAHLNLARLYFESLNDPEEAMDHARIARKLAPADPQIALTLGELAYRTGDHQWAMSLLEESSIKLSTDPDVRYALALAQLAVGQVAKAAESLQTALNQDPGFSQADDARERLSLCALIMNPAQLEDSAEWVDQLLTQDADHFPAMYVAALIREQRRDFSSAKGLYERILQPDQFPSFLPARKRLAILSIQELSPASPEAWQLANQARQEFPNDPEVARALGIVAYYNEQYQMSVQLLDEFTAGNQSDSEAYYYLGMACFRVERNDRSRSALQQALALGLQNPLADNARETLAKLTQ